MRSLLRVPAAAASPELFASSADAIMLDLTSSGPEALEAARHRAAALLSPLRSGALKVLVQVHPLGSGLIEADLDAVMGGAPDGIVLPAAVSGHHLSHLGAKLAVREAEFDLNDGQTGIVTLADTPAGVMGLSTFAGASPRLRAIAWDREALSGALGIQALGAGSLPDPLRIARGLTVLAAAAADVPALEAPLGAADDLPGLADYYQDAWRAGFAGCLATTPAQVAAINGSLLPRPPSAGGW